MSSKDEVQSISKIEQVKQAIMFAHATAGAPEIAEDESIDQKDPRVELVRDISHMALATGQFKELVFQVTNFDHPIHAMSVVHDGTEIELLRSMGLSKNLYDTFIGINKPMSGLAGHMRARMGILYPGMGQDLHPRALLGMGISGAPRESKQSRSLRERLETIMSG
jgi:hypothetical protein